MARTFSRYEIEVQDMFSSDLRIEAIGAETDGAPWEVGRIVIDGSAESAEYLATDDRIGIAWGADADWDDLLLVDRDIQKSIDAAIARWLDES